MNKIILLCRDCAVKKSEELLFGYYLVDWETDHSGFCEGKDCGVNTNHLKAVEIYEPNKKNT